MTLFMLDNARTDMAAHLKYAESPLGEYRSVMGHWLRQARSSESFGPARTPRSRRGRGMALYS